MFVYLSKNISIPKLTIRNGPVVFIDRFLGPTAIFEILYTLFYPFGMWGVEDLPPNPPRKYIFFFRELFSPGFLGWHLNFDISIFEPPNPQKIDAW